MTQNQTDAGTHACPWLDRGANTSPAGQCSSGLQPSPRPRLGAREDNRVRQKAETLSPPRGDTLRGVREGLCSGGFPRKQKTRYNFHQLLLTTPASRTADTPVHATGATLPTHHIARVKRLPQQLQSHLPAAPGALLGLSPGGSRHPRAQTLPPGAAAAPRDAGRPLLTGGPQRRRFTSPEGRRHPPAVPASPQKNFWGWGGSGADRGGPAPPGGASQRCPRGPSRRRTPGAASQPRPARHVSRGKERGSRHPHLPAQPAGGWLARGSARRRAAVGQRPRAWSPPAGPEGRARAGGERANRGAYHGGGRGRRGGR